MFTARKYTERTTWRQTVATDILNHDDSSDNDSVNASKDEKSGFDPSKKIVTQAFSSSAPVPRRYHHHHEYRSATNQQGPPHQSSLCDNRVPKGRTHHYESESVGLINGKENENQLLGDYRSPSVSPGTASVVSKASQQSQCMASVTTTSAMERLRNETRIVAPNVSRLSPQSAVEVRLQSTAGQGVAVLCSVDVLKMRSGFFHDVLCEQELQLEQQQQQHQQQHRFPPVRGGTAEAKTSASAPASAGRPASYPFSASQLPPASTALPSPSLCEAAATASRARIMWRAAIVVPEQEPLDAAAFLESLHEGRALFRGDWSLCWARLRYVGSPVLTNISFLSLTHLFIRNCPMFPPPPINSPAHLLTPPIYSTRPLTHPLIHLLTHLSIYCLMSP